MVNEWIPVSSGLLPEEKEVVQVTYINYLDKVTPLCDAFAYMVDDKWYWSFDDEKVIVKITAWKYSGEPYKGENYE